jgi:hypothetical protein
MNKDINYPIFDKTCKICLGAGSSVDLNGIERPCIGCNPELTNQSISYNSSSVNSSSSLYRSNRNVNPEFRQMYINTTMPIVQEPDIVISPHSHETYVTQLNRGSFFESVGAGILNFGKGVKKAGESFVAAYERYRNGGICFRCNNTGFKLKNGKTCTCGIMPIGNSQ